MMEATVKATRRLLATTLAVAMLLVACSTGTDAQRERQETFDAVWQTIHDEYFDPDFGGVDWRAVGDRYRPKVLAAETDSIFFVRLNEMVFELGVSHCGVIPREHPEWIGAPALFSEGTIGVDIRMIDGRAVITSIRPGSPAERSGLRPGFIIESIDGRPMSQLVQQALAPPRSPIDERMVVPQMILQHLYGEVGANVTLTYLDGDDTSHAVTLTRAERPGRTELAPGIPPSFAEFESRRLEGNIGYIRFNSFYPGLDGLACPAIERMSDAAGLIIDLRGNPGGVFPVRRAICESLVDERTPFWRYRRRPEVETVYLNPSDRAYTGPLVFLVDCMSASSSEETAGGMKAIGRATIVGERTPGIVLIMETLELADGSTLFYPVGQTIVADGSILEKNGVTPHIQVELTREALLAGRDPCLDVAVRHLRGEQ
jgi:carboxyl-terminal processing protease